MYLSRDGVNLNGITLRYRSINANVRDSRNSNSNKPLKSIESATPSARPASPRKVTTPARFFLIINHVIRLLADRILKNFFSSVVIYIYINIKHFFFPSTR